MKNCELMFKSAVFAWPNEKSQPQPPERKLLLTPRWNDGALGAKAAGVTEWSSHQKPDDEAHGWWLLAALQG